MLLHEEPDRRPRGDREVLAVTTLTASATTTRGSHGVADVLAPLLLHAAPSVGSHRPDRSARASSGSRGGCAGWTSGRPATRRGCSPSSIRDLLDRWFESPEVKGVMAINGIIGTWAGPGRARHRVRDDAPHDRRRRRREARVVGLPDRRDGRGQRRDPALGRVVRRRRAHRARRSSGSSCATAGSSAWRSRDGTELRAPTVVAATHPQITFLRQIERDRAPGRLRRRHRAVALAARVSVKVNVALSELPDFIADPGNEPHERYTRLGRAVPLDRLPRARLPRRPRRPRRPRGRSPTA